MKGSSTKKAKSTKMKEENPDQAAADDDGNILMDEPECDDVGALVEPLGNHNVLMSHIECYLTKGSMMDSCPNWKGSSEAESVDEYLDESVCSFLEETGIPILTENKQNKYAKKYEEFGDDDTFLCLNEVLLAMFVESETKSKWKDIKGNLFEILSKNKMNKSIEILTERYSDNDVLFLQEVRNDLDVSLLPE